MPHKLISVEQSGWYLADDIFRYIFVNEKFCILIKISPKFVPKCPIDNTSVLVQVMAWRWTGDKPLSQAMLTRFTDAYMLYYGVMFKLEAVIIHHQVSWTTICCACASRNATHEVMWYSYLTYRGHVTHICVRRVTITGSDNGLLPVWHQAII